MNLTRLSAIAEIVSSIAILVTLVYLAIETKQNTEAVQSSVRQEALNTNFPILLSVLDRPELDAFYYKTSLTDEEKVLLSVFLTMIIETRQTLWLQYQAGMLDKVAWTATLAPIGNTLSAPQTRKWWSNVSRGPNSFGYDEGFVSQIDEFLSDIPLRGRSDHLTAFD